MKSNLKILEESGTLELKWPLDDDFVSLMKKAQTEILKEAMRRYKLQGHPIYAGQGNFKTIDTIVLELIKEIEQ